MNVGFYIDGFNLYYGHVRLRVKTGLAMARPQGVGNDDHRLCVPTGSLERGGTKPAGLLHSRTGDPDQDAYFGALASFRSLRLG